MRLKYNTNAQILFYFVRLSPIFAYVYTNISSRRPRPSPASHSRAPRVVPNGGYHPRRYRREMGKCINLVLHAKQKTKTKSVRGRYALSVSTFSQTRSRPWSATVPSPLPFSRPSPSHRHTSPTLATIAIPPSPLPFSRPSPSCRQQPYRHLTRSPRRRYRAQHVEAGSGV